MIKILIFKHFMINLNSSITDLNRVGKSTAQQMKKLGLEKVKDLLAHYPFRYDDFSNILSIKELKTQKTGTIKARLDLIDNHRSPKKRTVLTEAIVSDQTDSLKVIWFNQPFLVKNLKTGEKVYLAGKINYDSYYGLQLTNPSYEICQDKSPTHTGRLVPIYPATGRLTQKQIRFLIRQSLPLAQNIEDWLPREIRVKYNLINLPLSLEQIHFPQDKFWQKKAAHRLKFDELFLIQSKNQLIRKKLQKRRAPIIEFKEKETKEFVKKLPFSLTTAQRKSAWEIINDLKKQAPMNRLLEGDVGSGKTVVAIIAILNVLLNDYQVAYMVPTEILAEQHFKNITELLKDYNFKIALLTRTNALTNKKTLTKTNLQKNIALKKIELVIGTHSLIQEKIQFKNLGLALIDEQHRFGVKQRASLIKKSSTIKNFSKNYCPHFLSLTATPIPRSIALTLYGDLDLSLIDQLPLGRKPIITQIIKPKQKVKTYEFIRKEIQQGRQAFVACPLIDPSDKLGVNSVKEEFKKLKEKIFPEFKIAFLHGRMKSQEKDKIMRDFNQNKIQILVSTTVVEVGIDIPNASLMIIEGAERFGLAQLYQLRGRIGRDKHQSYCFLVLEEEKDLPIARERLQALIKAKNGFELAEKDLLLRGPGEIFNTRQSGFLSDLKIAQLSDVEIIKQTKEAVQIIFKQDPELKNYELLKDKLNKFITIDHLE
jgi:ATP-dependent DNA helicase RecG